MRICFFGTYNVEEGYPRVRVLMEGLRRAGHQVDQCRIPFLGDAASKLEGASSPARGLRLALNLILIHLRLCWRFLRMPRPQMMVVGYPGQLDLFTARLLATVRGVPLVLDAFVSLYDTMVNDRGMVRPGSLQARLLRWIDRTTCLLADAVLLDTSAHIDYFTRRLHLPREKFIRVLIGEDDRIFSADPEAAPPGQRDRLEVLYFGSFIPLHGLPAILETARLLGQRPDEHRIRITICGRGQLSPELQRDYPPESLPHVRFIDQWLSYRELIPLIESADVCLGIFGITGKSGRVIPLKVYAALALGRAVVTGDSPGARELLVDGESARLVPPGDPLALQEALLQLDRNRQLVARLGQSAAALYRKVLTPRQIAATMLEDLSGLDIPRRLPC